jgi:hypothetical protein
MSSSSNHHPTKRPRGPQTSGSNRLQSEAVTFLSMTAIQSRLLLVQLGALLAATSGIFLWFNKYFSEFYKNDPALSILFVLAIPLYITVFSTGPQLWRRRRDARRRSVMLTSNPAAAFSGYYRLDPYIPRSPKEFHREDQAHITILDWVRKSTERVLFLSGVSGGGENFCPRILCGPYARICKLGNTQSTKLRLSFASTK